MARIYHSERNSVHKNLQSNLFPLKDEDQESQQSCFQTVHDMFDDNSPQQMLDTEQNVRIFWRIP